MSNKLPYKTCAVIVNPRSTHYARSRMLIRQLKTIFPEDAVITYPLSKTDYRESGEVVKFMADNLNADTLLCIAGGDGTNSFVLNLLLTSPKISEAARHAAVLPMWGGNANDLAYMANGMPRNVDLKAIISKGSAVAVHPMDVVQKQGDDCTESLALCYASFGASAYASHRMNLPNHRHKRGYGVPGAHLFVEAVGVAKSLVAAKRFSCEIDGKNQTIHDLLLINGSRIAKIDRAPITLATNHFFEIRIFRKHPIVLAYIWSLLRGLRTKRSPVTKRTVVMHDATWLQQDGEVSFVPAGTVVEVTRSDKKFYLLSTKL